MSGPKVIGQMILFWFVVNPAAVAYAQTPTEIVNTDRVESEENLARQWQLSIEEWAHYRTLMNGPRGIWSPDLDPVSVLGIHAETEAERTRYAELLVMLEYRRVEQELEFQRAYNVAARKLFPDLLPVKGSEQIVDSSPIWAADADRIAWAGSVDSERCPLCVDSLASIRQEWAQSAEIVLDLFLADAGTDDELRRWAMGAGVSAEAIAVGRITLNHTRPPFEPSSVGLTVSPRVFDRREGRWASRAP